MIWFDTYNEVFFLVVCLTQIQPIEMVQQYNIEATPKLKTFTV